MYPRDCDSGNWPSTTCDLRWRGLAHPQQHCPSSAAERDASSQLLRFRLAPPKNASEEAAQIDSRKNHMLFGGRCLATLHLRYWGKEVVQVVCQIAVDFVQMRFAAQLQGLTARVRVLTVTLRLQQGAYGFLYLAGLGWALDGRSEWLARK